MTTSQHGNMMKLGIDMSKGPDHTYMFFSKKQHYFGFLLHGRHIGDIKPGAIVLKKKVFYKKLSAMSMQLHAIHVVNRAQLCL